MISRIATTLCGLLLCAVVYAQTIDARNSLIGVITETPDASKRGKQVTFVDLRTDRPTVVWPSGYDYKMSKVFENEELMVLQFVADLTGSTDTIYIEKKNKRFVMISVGALEAVVQNKPLQVDIHRGHIE